jgi:hypothetical protein
MIKDNQKIEVLLKKPMGMAFDTRKTLNRNNIRVPNDIVEKINSGVMTCEMIDELAKKYTIFMYQTQITIHGEFDDLSIKRIGNYKNILHNGNLSLGLKYSAIDVEKIKSIKEEIYHINQNATDKGRRFMFIENSTDRVFRMRENLKKETANEQIEKYLKFVDEISEIKIYGYVSVYRQPLLYGGVDIVLDVHPLAIQNDKIKDFTRVLLGMDEAGFNESLKQADFALDVLKKQSEEKERIRKEAAELYSAQRMSMLIPIRKDNGIEDSIVELTKDNIICKYVFDTVNNEPVFKSFTFYKVGESIGFGKFRILKAVSTEFDLSNLDWHEFKCSKPSDFKSIKGNNVIIRKVEPLVEISSKSLTEIENTKVDVTKSNSTSNGVTIVDYSEKSIAVIGDTYAIKDILSDLGGRFNKFLTINNEKVAGWIFAKTKETLVKEKLSIFIK